ncbi:MAG TPA: SDR family oxidoreductase [Planctomycetota bacterium]|nr:SDR family oxidoreductase [Planctomycetota bacterium]
MTSTPLALEGRNAIITGVSRGLGAEIARAYVEAGASVLVCARSEADLEKNRSDLEARARPGQRVLALAADVGRREHITALVAAAADAFQGKIDVLVNNAGGYGPLGPIDTVDWDAWVHAIAVNLLGTVCACREVLPHMRRRGYGKIVNLSGGGATQPIANLSAYCASKAGVVRFTETLAVEVAGARIDVNAIAPGALNTKMLDEVLEAGPAKVGQAFYDKALKQKQQGGASLARGASLAVFLGSAASDGVTGRLLSAIWDCWETLPERKGEVAGTDVYTLRRINAKDRGKTWDEAATGK